jgi:O-antigen/teichoic acid export membrane protein
MKRIIPEIKTAMQIALLKHQDMHSVAGNKAKTANAYYIIIIAAFLGFAGKQLFMGFFRPEIGMAVGVAVIQILMTIACIYVLSFIAKSIFKGSAKHDEFFRVMGYAFIVNWITIVPMFGFISAIWGLILIYVILKVVHKLTTGGALGTIIVGIIVMAVISTLISPVFSGFGYGHESKSGGAFDYMNKNGFKMDVKTLNSKL